MRLGATLVHLDDAAPFATARWAERLAAAGFESLWAPELIGRGPLVPDPFVTLAAAAAVTGEDVALGTATVQVPLHHPVDLAHRVLSLLALTGPRCSFGVSPGSTATDHLALDRDPATRFAAFRSDLDRVRRLVATGRDGDVVLGPAPPSRPDLLLGSWGRNVERAAREFDGWLASGYRRTPDEIIEALGRYRAAGGHRAVVCAVPVEQDLDATGAVLQRYAAAGFDEAVVLFGPDDPDPEAVRALLPRRP